MLPSLRQFVRVLPRRNVFVNVSAFSTGKQGFAPTPQQQREAASKGGQAESHKAPELNKAPPSFIINPNRGVNPQKRVTQPEKSEFKVGDLVRYNAGANTTEGIVKALHDHPVKDEFGRVHQATSEDPIAEIENHYTKKIVFHHFGVLHWLARAEGMPAAYRQDATPNRPTPSKNNVEPEPIHQDSPLQIDFAPGDIVRFQVGKGITAGEIEAIYISPQHDEFGNFHNATQENPMARIINLWTKRPLYHHLNVLELVKTAETPGNLGTDLLHGKEVPEGSYFAISEEVEFTRPSAGAARTTTSH